MLSPKWTEHAAFDYITSECPMESDHRASVLHRKGDMIEASDASSLLSAERTDTSRPTTAAPAAATPWTNLRRVEWSAILRLPCCHVRRFDAGCHKRTRGLMPIIGTLSRPTSRLQFLVVRYANGAARWRLMQMALPWRQLAALRRAL